ncbi:uncharacterized protein [Euphorbia lathyris]|uniref:uncharacterized protein n=1 Tax=Euphorbia lathyris TaxID=212925 RepID=UPI00331321AC
MLVTLLHSVSNIAIDKLFAENGLSLSRLQGQSYDGFSNMPYELNRIKGLILNENKHAHYIHCFDQEVQLVVMADAGPEVYLFFQSLFKIVNIVGTECEMNDALQQLQHDEVVKQIQNGGISKESDMNQEMTLTRLGHTHWGSHYETIIRLFDMWNSVARVLVTIEKYGTYSQSQAIAENLLNEMFTFEFVFVGRLMMNILEITSALPLILRANDKEIEKSIQIIEVVKKNLQVYRKNGWEELLKEVTNFCSAQEIPIPNMEDILSNGAKRLIHGKSTTNLYYFRGNIFIKVLDFLSFYSII